VDFVTSLPITFILSLAEYGGGSSNSVVRMPRLLRFLKALKVLKVLRVMKLMALMSEWNTNTADSKCATSASPLLQPSRSNPAIFRTVFLSVDDGLTCLVPLVGLEST
jgi:hypothetical protein